MYSIDPHGRYIYTQSHVMERQKYYFLGDYVREVLTFLYPSLVAPHPLLYFYYLVSQIFLFIYFFNLEFTSGWVQLFEHLKQLVAFCNIRGPTLCHVAMPWSLVLGQRGLLQRVVCIRCRWWLNVWLSAQGHHTHMLHVCSGCTFSSEPRVNAYSLIWLHS